MTLQPFIMVAIFGVAVWAALEAWIRWRTSRLASRALDPAIHSDRHASPSRARLEPEGRFIVRVSDAGVVCERPDGKVEQVAWAVLQKVEVVTTDDGPFAPDVFWVLHGAAGGCAVPQGATGESELLQRLQALPGFDNDAVIDAMASTSNRRFVCWRR